MKKLLSILIFILLLTATYSAYADSKITDFEAKAVDSSGMSAGDKEHEAANYAPYENFSLSKRKKADLILLTDYTGAKLSGSLSQINSLKAALNSKNVDLSVNVVSGDSAVKIGDLTGKVPFFTDSSPRCMNEDCAYINRDNIFIVNPRAGYKQDTQMVMNVESVKDAYDLLPFYYNSPSSSVNYSKDGRTYFVKTYDGQLYSVASDWWNSTYSPVYLIEKSLIKSGVRAIGDGGLYIDDNNRLYNYTRFSLYYHRNMLDTDTTPIADNVKTICDGSNRWYFNQYLPDNWYTGRDVYVYFALMYITNDNTLYGSVIKYSARAPLFEGAPMPPEYKQIRTFKIAENVASAEFGYIYGNHFIFTKTDGSVWNGVLDATQESGLCVNPSPILNDVVSLKTHGWHGFYSAITKDGTLYRLNYNYLTFTYTLQVISTNVREADGSQRSWLILHNDGYFEALYADNSERGPIDRQVELRLSVPVSEIAEIRALPTQVMQGNCSYLVFLKDGRVLEAEYYEGECYANMDVYWINAHFEFGNGIDKGYYIDQNGAYHRYINVDVDSPVVSKWASNVSVPATPIYSVNTGGVTAITPRAGSDRYFICLADGVGNDYRGGVGSYFSLGNMNKALMTYLMQNNYSVYAVTDPQAYDYILPDPGRQEVSIRQLVSNAPAEGAYYPPGQLQQVLDRINGRYSVSEAIENYALLNEEIVIDSVYGDSEIDPRLSLRYRITHVDPYCFENSLGVMPDSGAYFTDPPLKFDRTGKYELAIQARDNPKNDSRFDHYRLWSSDENSKYVLYVHRKPIAQFSVGFSGMDASGNYILDLSEYSYDPDHESQTDRGITESSWEWKEFTDGSWHGDIPSVLPPGKDYLIKLVVKDREGAWSDPLIASFSLSDIQPLQYTAQARTLDNKFSMAGIPASEYLEAYNLWTRYPYDVNVSAALYDGTTKKTTGTGAAPAARNGSDISWNNIIHQVPAGLPDGNYTYKVSFAGTYGTWSLDFPVTVNTPINLTPNMPSKAEANMSAGISASTSKYADTTTVQLFIGTVYQTSALNMSGSLNGDNKNWSLNYNIPDGIPSGDYTARFTATTPNGNSETKDIAFRLENMKITGVTLSGYWNHWRGQVDMFGVRLSNEPHRFASLECVKINVNTTGNPDRIAVRFSPELESMVFADSSGSVYDYNKDFFGYYVNFPADSTLAVTDNHAYWEYYLPLAPSTRDTAGNRLRPQYKMTVTAYKGTHTDTYVIDDIDITGNIYDLTYMQPLN